MRNGVRLAAGMFSVLAAACSDSAESMSGTWTVVSRTVVRSVGSSMPDPGTFSDDPGCATYLPQIAPRELVLREGSAEVLVNGEPCRPSDPSTPLRISCPCASNGGVCGRVITLAYNEGTQELVGTEEIGFSTPIRRPPYCDVSARFTARRR